MSLISGHNHLSFYPYDYEIQWLETPKGNNQPYFEIPCVISTKQHIYAELGVRLNCSIPENYFIGFNSSRLMFAYNHLYGLRLAYKTNVATSWAIPDDQMIFDPNIATKFFDCDLICDYSLSSQSIIVNGQRKLNSKVTDFEFTTELFTIKHLSGQTVGFGGNRFKYCRLYVDDKKILDLIPVVEQERGCVFDKVSQICYEPITEMNFIVGPSRGGMSI